jgi:hypothetical protein
MMKVIAEQPWSYVLFDDGEYWVLTYLIGGVVEIDVSIRLNSDEIEAIKTDASAIMPLLTNMKSNRSAYADREIRPPVWPPK